MSGLLLIIGSTLCLTESFNVINYKGKYSHYFLLESSGAIMPGISTLQFPCEIFFFSSCQSLKSKYQALHIFFKHAFLFCQSFDSKAKCVIFRQHCTPWQQTQYRYGYCGGTTVISKTFLCSCYANALAYFIFNWNSIAILWLKSINSELLSAML